ncbi:hypothetical protein [Geotalea uraniireducens]|uniref:Uncharacterized protein n=1 Tax=Geotalea uraniireducens (strain Rf4) TaxID=351605 RepID=A5GAT6_GEOUR|nr:hypothetical protein [Geotalea uraniireducens]ABQ25309.1 hypothetical protein Gura_1103 [Geotalea uraniireducens Rf4]
MIFYHNHTLGLIGVIIYAGEAAGYLLWDQYEEDLISGTNVTGINTGNNKVLTDLDGAYHFGITLIIQDNTLQFSPI